MTTIREVAALAKVSVATVSRVMNSDIQFKVSAETRKRVMEAAAELDYSLEQRRRAGGGRERSLKVGCVVNRYPAKYVDSFYLCLISGFETELSRLGCTLSFSKTVKEMEMGKIELKALLKNLDAIVVMEYLSVDTMACIMENVPTVLGVELEYPGMTTIAHDRMEASMMAMEHLISNGHKRIAYLGGQEYYLTPPQDPIVDLAKSKRFWGYRYSLLCHDLDYDAGLVKDCGWTIDRCRAQVREIMSGENPPTAILAASDTMAIAAISACGELGLKIPQNISIIGISDNEESTYSNPPLTTVRIPQDALGLLAARMIKHPIGGEPSKTIVPLTLIVRGSVCRI